MRTELETICPVAGCLGTHRAGHAMCRVCWEAVPSYLRAEVYRARHRRSEAQGDEREAAAANYRDAVTRAVRSVEDPV